MNLLVYADVVPELFGKEVLPHDLERGGSMVLLGIEDLDQLPYCLGVVHAAEGNLKLASSITSVNQNYFIMAPKEFQGI